jgi:hypothetical protein
MRTRAWLLGVGFLGIGLSCDGVMNARGSGDLEGVHFKFNWGPGWFPFAYSGTVSGD